MIYYVYKSALKFRDFSRRACISGYEIEIHSRSFAGVQLLDFDVFAADLCKRISFEGRSASRLIVTFKKKL